jgi:hypothetical protein
MHTSPRLRVVRDSMPVRYRVHPLRRLFGIAINTVLIISALNLMFTKVNLDSSNFIKVTLLVILYIGIDSLYRHLTSLNEVIFTPECLWLRFVLKRGIPIPWENIKSVVLEKRITYYVYIGYVDLKGKRQVYKTAASFPRMIEILFNIADLAPHIGMNDELKKMIDVLRELTFGKQETENEV